jgi:UDP-glucuronate decarboxylase
MNYLVTGGAGFIGSHLVRRLLESSEYNHVTVIDSLITGTVDNLPFHPRLIFRSLDVSDTQWINNYASETIADIQGLKIPDVIFNLACPASPVSYQRNPIHTTLTSVMGAYHALLLAQRYKARILQASTSEIYGDPTISPQPEYYWGNVNSFGPRSCYDEGKRAAESLFYDFHKKFDVDIRLARIFNTYGPNMAVDDGRVVSNFVVQALKGESITIYGDGRQTRSFCYVDDLVDGLLALSISNCQEPVNLGNPIEFNMLDLAEMVLSITKSTSKIEYKSLPEDDPQQRRPNISRARTLGWEPKVALQEGLENTVEYFRRKLNNV